MRNTLFILLILLGTTQEISARRYFTTIYFNYPLYTNSLKGIYSTSLAFNYFIKRNEFPHIRAGLSYSAVHNANDDKLNNLYYNIGLCKPYAVKESIGLYPYATIGYSRYKGNQSTNDGAAIEIGADIAKGSYYRTVALHISYRQNFVSDFEFNSEVKTESGITGTFLIGLSVIL